jgi:hypothetical protein
MGNYLCCGPRKHLRTDVSTDPDTRTLGPRVTIKMKKTAKSKRGVVSLRGKMAKLSVRVDELDELNMQLTKINIASGRKIVRIEKNLENEKNLHDETIQMWRKMNTMTLR